MISKSIERKAIGEDIIKVELRNEWDMKVVCTLVWDTQSFNSMKEHCTLKQCQLLSSEQQPIGVMPVHLKRTTLEHQIT